MTDTYRSIISSYCYYYECIYLSISIYLFNHLCLYLFTRRKLCRRHKVTWNMIQIKKFCNNLHQFSFLWSIIFIISRAKISSKLLFPFIRQRRFDNRLLSFHLIGVLVSRKAPSKDDIYIYIYIYIIYIYMYMYSAKICPFK